jgi:hypothetical protein
MLSTFIVSLLIGLANPSIPQIEAEELYHVLFVQGQILNKTSGAMLQRGDKLKATDKVIFKSKDAKAVVMSNVRGRFVMSANPSKVGSELAEVVSNIVSPLKTNSKLSTRGGEVAGEVAVKDFKAHFGKSENGVLPVYLIMGDKYEFKVDRGMLTLGTEDAIAVKYKLVNGTKGTKGLGNKDQTGTMAIGKETFGGKIELTQITEFQFHKWNKTTKKVDENVLASFRPIFINTEDVKASFKEYLATNPVDESLKKYMAGEKDSVERLAAMSEENKKVELLFYFLSELYASNESGEVNVNTVKVDYDVLTKFVKDNNL